MKSRIKKGVKLARQQDGTPYTVGDLLFSITDIDGIERRFWLIFASGCGRGAGRPRSEEAILDEFYIVREEQDCVPPKNDSKDFISAIHAVIDEASRQTDPTRAARLTAFGILTFLDGSEENFLGTGKWRVCTTDGQIVNFNHHDL